MGSNPRHLAQTKNGPVAGAVSESMVGDEGFRVRLRRPRPAAARPAPCALRRKTLARFLGSAPRTGFDPLGG